MGDFYTQDPAMLLGKPKATIADYVERNGILVPRRFATLEDALASSAPVIARSEHPQDYDGISGLLNSPLITAMDKEQIMGKVLSWESGIKRYCELMGIDEFQFKKEVSISFWEQIQGANISLAADSSVAGRYHVFLFNKRGNQWKYVDFDYGAKTSHLPKKAVEILTKAVEFYEKIRSLENFDRNHCPIIELQYYRGVFFFLQYHRTRDFRETDFKLELDRNSKKDEFEAIFTRGATSANGATIETIVAYAPDANKSYQWSLHNEQGSMDIHGNQIFAEIMTRGRILQIGNLHPSDASCPGHLTLSQILKPEIYVALDFDSFFGLIPEKEIRGMQRRAGETGKNQSITLNVISDGRKAYISRAS